jgi:glucuronate isomerase
MGFITETFLLQTDTARRLYSTYAKAEPILDYHCHLSPADIAANRRFQNLFEIWLEGDHYKWRIMRTNGVPERYCTGDASPYEKFLAWARSVPYALRNVAYQWTHLELKRYFEIDTFLDETSAKAVWDQANERLTNGDLSARGILKKFHVKALCTTDDPTDSLQDHKRILASDLETRVYPTFRPDKALKTEEPNAFNEWTDKLGVSANVDIVRLKDFLGALQRRHTAFHEFGCRLSDHGLNYCYADPCTENEAESIFDNVRGGKKVSAAQSSKFASFLMFFFGSLDAEKGWTKQLHLGAFRNANSRMLKSIGPDTGFDSIGDWSQAGALGAYLDRLDCARMLPKTIVYNVHPVNNYVFATLIGNFQDGSTPGKMQFGSGWWFLDQKEGMEWQLNALSNCGLLSRFIGMITDSRSFMSYPRHEYFRRVLCNLLGAEIERGELPDNEELVGKMVRNICFDNAANYLGLPSVPPNSGNSDVPVGHSPKHTGKT